jgi:hypothetical protein
MITVERKPKKVIEVYHAEIELDKSYFITINKIITEETVLYEVDYGGMENPLLSDILQGYVENQRNKNLLPI